MTTLSALAKSENSFEQLKLKLEAKQLFNGWRFTGDMDVSAQMKSVMMLKYRNENQVDTE